MSDRALRTATEHDTILQYLMEAAVHIHLIQGRVPGELEVSEVRNALGAFGVITNITQPRHPADAQHSDNTYTAQLKGSGIASDRVWLWSDRYSCGETLIIFSAGLRRDL